MKKIIAIVVGLLVTLCSYSQDFSKIISATKSEYRNEKWVVISTDYPTDMFLIMKDWDVTIGTYKFKTYDESEKTVYDTHVCYSWKCINGNGEKCMFMLKKFKPEVSTHMLYGIVYPTGVMYEYETE